MLALLEEKRAALISRVVTRGLDPNAPLKPSGLEWLDEIPTHWEICQLKRVWASSDYGLSESIRDEGYIAVLRMSCIVDGRVDVSKSGMITEVDGHLLLRRNDLLFNRTNSLDQIAKVGLVDFDPEEPLTFASYLVRIRTNHRAVPQYLVALLNASLFLEFARKNAIPAIGQANLSPTRYGEIHIPLPPKAEQEEIVTFLKRDAETSTPVREHIRSSINLLKERRAALISAAVTGQIPLEEMPG
nr:restriction endonuclease subunit S [Thiocapsa imhoffii]